MLDHGFNEVGINRVEMLINGKVVATDRKAAYRLALNPKKYGKKFTVQLRAYDKAGTVTTLGNRRRSFR